MSLTAIPTLRSSLPADGGTVGNSADLFLYFSEAVKGGTGTIRLYKSNGTLVETFDVDTGDGDNGGQVSFNTSDVNVVLKPGTTQVRIVASGDNEQGLDRTFDLGSSGTKPEGGLAEFSRSTVRINPGANLDINTGYYLQIDSGAILDYSNDAYAGINNTTSLNFTTGNAAPRLLQSWPADQSWFNSASKLHFHFSEDVFAGADTGTSTFKLYKADGTLVESFNTATGLGTGEGSLEIFGSDVTIDPGADLLDGQEYYLQIGSTALKDEANLHYAGINDTTTLNFKAFDYAPDLTGANFSDGELDFKTDIELYFSEPVYAVGEGSVSLYHSSDDSLVESFNLYSGDGDEGGSLEMDGNRIRIDPGPELEAGTGYYLLFDTGAVWDSTEQYFTGVSDTSTLEFLAIDAPPRLWGTNPDDDGSIDIAHDIFLHFSEDVFGGSGVLGLYKTADDSLVQSFNVANAAEGGAIEFDGSTVVLRPTANLLPGLSYYVKADPGAILDDAEQSFAGIADKTTFNFTATDLAPTLVHSWPEDDGDHELGNDLYLNFSEAVQAVSGGTVKLYLADGDVLLETFNVVTGVGDNGGMLGMVGDSSVWIDPHDDLDEGEEYYLKVSAGAFKDFTNNPFAGITSKTALNFTAVDNAPFLENSWPVDGGQWDKNSSLRLQFSEAIWAGEGSIRLYHQDGSESLLVETFSVGGGTGDDGGTLGIYDRGLRLRPGSELQVGENYYVEIDGGALVDSSYNSFASTTLDFTAYDGPPSVEYVGWPESTGSPVTVVFTEDLLAGSGDIRLYRSSDRALLETFDIGDMSGDDGGELSIDGEELIVTPGVELENGVSYYLGIDAGALLDVNEQAYPGTGTRSEIWFEVNDAAPTLVHTYPSDNDTLAAGDNIELYFTEDVFGHGGDIRLYESDGTLVESFDTGNSTGSAGGTLSISGSKVTIDPEYDLEPGTGYYLEIDGNALKDDSGQFYGGISDDSTFNFSVPDTTLQLYSSYPGDNGDVDVAGDLFLNFSADVVPGTGTIRLYRDFAEDPDELLESFDVSNAAYSDSIEFSGDTVILRPDGNLVPGGNYWIEIDATAVKTADDVYFAGIDDETTLNFTAVDQAPTLWYSIPTDGSTHEAVNDLYLYFSEQIWAGSGANAYVKLYEQGGTLVETFNVELNAGSNEGSMQISEGRDYVMFNPGAPLTAGTSYYVLIGDTAFKDSANQYYAGISSTSGLNFTAVDEAPELVWSSAEDAHLHPWASFGLYFSEPVQLGSASIITLYDGNDAVLETYTNGVGNAGGSVDLYGHYVYIDPELVLVPGDYYFEISSEAFEDSSGNPYPASAATVLDFTVSDAPPELYYSWPSDNDTDHYPTDNIELYFTESVTLVSGTVGLYLADTHVLLEEFDAETGLGSAGGALYIGEGGDHLVIDPEDDLLDGEDYYLLMDAGVVVDEFDQPFEGFGSPSDFNFTAFNEAPEIYYSYPSDGEVFDDEYGGMYVNFTESVTADSGFVWLYDEDNNLVEKYDVGTGLGTQGGELELYSWGFYVYPGVGLLIDAEGYYLNIDATAFKDDLGKYFAGIDDGSTLNFTVYDHVPDLDDADPAHNDYVEFDDTELVLYFTEPVFPISGAASDAVRLLQWIDGEGALVESFDPGSGSGSAGGSLSFSGTGVVTLVAGEEFIVDGEYYLEIDNDAFRDATDNWFDGLAAHDYTFFVVDTVAPELVDTNIVDGELEIYSDLVLTFSEEIEGHDNGTAIRLFHVESDTAYEIVTFEYNGGWTETGGTLTIAGNILTIDPADTLMNGDDYYLLIDDGALADAAGNHFIGLLGVTDLEFTAYSPPA